MINTAKIFTFQRLRLKFLKYFSIAKVSSRNTVAYVMNFVGRNMNLVFRLWLFSQLYLVTYQSVNQTTIGGLNVAQVVWLLMFSQSFQMSGKRVSRQIEDEVKNGSVAYSLNRPYSFIFKQLATSWGNNVPLVAANLIIGSLMVLILVGPITFSFVGVLSGLLLVFFGNCLNFTINLSIGLMAFWLEDINALRWIFDKGAFIFGGILVPLSLFPVAVQNVAELLPFSQLFYSSARMLVSFDLFLFTKYLLVQVSWLLVFSALAYLIFKKAIKYVCVNGG